MADSVAGQNQETKPVARPATAPAAPRPAPRAKPLPSIEEERRAEKVASLVMGARLAARRGQPEESRRQLQQALALAPHDAGALELLGDLYLEEGETEKAMAVFEQGREHHPRHAAFEEKIAVCLLDLEEMRRDKDRQALLLQGQVPDQWLDRKPAQAMTLSVLMPGAGQFYNEENERGVVFAGLYLLAWVAGYIPINIGYRLMDQQPGLHRHGLSAAFAQLNGFWQGWVWVMALLALAVYVLALLDSAQGAERANQLRRAGWL